MYQNTAPQYVTEVEVSKITGMALSTLRNDRWKSRGIPYCKIGKAVRYDLVDVIGFMNARKVRLNDTGEA